MLHFVVVYAAAKNMAELSANIIICYRDDAVYFAVIFITATHSL